MQSSSKWYHIDSESRSVVSQWFQDNPRLPRVIDEIAQQAQHLWARGGARTLPLRVAVDTENDPLAMILSIPGTADPKKDTDWLWALMTWRSTYHPQDVSSLPIILLLEYLLNAAVHPERAFQPTTVIENA